MNHIDTLPLVSRQRMSPIPSPLKSPVATTVQLVETVPIHVDEMTCAPFMSQIATLPLVSFQSQSYLPSPLKSRCPTIDHEVATVPNHVDDLICPPFMSHIAILPLVSRQAMSLLPSPLKSCVLVIHIAICPIWLPAVSVNHSALSGPGAMTLGLL